MCMCVRAPRKKMLPQDQSYRSAASFLLAPFVWSRSWEGSWPPCKLSGRLPNHGLTCHRPAHSIAAGSFVANCQEGCARASTHTHRHAAHMHACSHGCRFHRLYKHGLDLLQGFEDVRQVLYRCLVSVSVPSWLGEHGLPLPPRCPFTRNRQHVLSFRCIHKCASICKDAST